MKGSISAVDKKYDMDCTWASDAKSGFMNINTPEAEKTSCALYAKENCMGFMDTLGRKESEKFEGERKNFRLKTQKICDVAVTYQYGKWIMFEIRDSSMFEDYLKLLSIKRKSSRK